MNFEKLLGIRPTFLLGEKYRLDLTWSTIEYVKEGECKFTKAKFSGPALNSAEEIQSGDHIFIDFYKQYYVKVKNVYIGQLKWGNILYNKDNSVTLQDCYLTYDIVLNNNIKLGNKDKIVIDTKGHDIEEHMFNFNYVAYVINNDEQLYNFSGVK